MFWEFAPQQAWWWARRRYGEEAAVVGALVRLGRCLDLLDPSNAALLRSAREDLERTLQATGQRLPSNANNHKYMNCALFNWLFELVARGGHEIDSCRAVFVPLEGRRMPDSGIGAEYSKVRTCSSPCGLEQYSRRLARAEG